MANINKKGIIIGIIILVIIMSQGDKQMRKRATPGLEATRVFSSNTVVAGNTITATYDNVAGNYMGVIEVAPAGWTASPVSPSPDGKYRFTTDYGTDFVMTWTAPMTTGDYVFDAGEYFVDPDSTWTAFDSSTISVIAQTYSCIPLETIPSNSHCCSGQCSGLTGDMSWTLIDTCDGSTKCQYECDTGYHREGNVCVGDSATNLATRVFSSDTIAPGGTITATYDNVAGNYMGVIEVAPAGWTASPVSPSPDGKYRFTTDYGTDFILTWTAPMTTGDYVFDEGSYFVTPDVAYSLFDSDTITVEDISCTQDSPDCDSFGDECNDGKCNTGTGVCYADPKIDGTSCTGGTCLSGACVPTDCGNGVIDGTEDCDGTNLGGSTCVSQGYDSGTLSCKSDCTFDTSNCVTTYTCEELGGSCQDDTCSNLDMVDVGGSTDCPTMCCKAKAPPGTDYMKYVFLIGGFMVLMMIFKAIQPR